MHSFDGDQLNMHEDRKERIIYLGKNEIKVPIFFINGDNPALF
jgi:hypothetical protein